MKYEDILNQYHNYAILCVYDGEDDTKMLYIADKNDIVIHAFECKINAPEYAQITKHIGLKLYEVMRIYKKHNAIYYIIEEK